MQSEIASRGHTCAHSNKGTPSLLYLKISHVLMNVDCRMRLLLLLVACARRATSLSLSVKESGSISVCTNKACRKAGSQDTLQLLRSLASTVAAPVDTSLINSCGCLGSCGMGPNVYGAKTDEVFHDNRPWPWPLPSPRSHRNPSLTLTVRWTLTLVLT